MGREDLTKVAPLWLSVTEDVREDPEVRGHRYVAGSAARGALSVHCVAGETLGPLHTWAGQCVGGQALFICDVLRAWGRRSYAAWVSSA